ncbi:hypothetical protein Bbelb_008530 [Branchiostoma belcheri]|nr:hypothetical protein Bbelb_008530 [Branchiostoma belcheri]
MQTAGFCSPVAEEIFNSTTSHVPACNMVHSSSNTGSERTGDIKLSPLGIHQKFRLDKIEGPSDRLGGVCSSAYFLASVLGLEQTFGRLLDHPSTSLGSKPLVGLAVIFRPRPLPSTGTTTDLSPAGFPVSADFLYYAQSSLKTLRSAVIEAWLAAPNALGAEGIALRSRRSGYQAIRPRSMYKRSGTC